MKVWRFLAAGVLCCGALLPAGCTSFREVAEGPNAQPIVLPRPTMPPHAVPVQPSTLARWPWPGERRDSPHRGVTHWLAYERDGTMLDLLRFDFKTNPRLRFELYAQDEDDKKPFDNVIDYWPMGVGQATRHLNERFAPAGKSVVVAAWNGPFFGYHRKPGAGGETAFHVSPVVLRGRVHHNTANHRWALGVQYSGGTPHFKLFHKPGRALLEKEFDFASGSVQCLLKDGRPLLLEPFPAPGQAFKQQPVPSTPQQAGHIPLFDHAKFSRASLGWSRDSTQLFLLLVRESNRDNEGQSIRAFLHGEAQSDGWTVADLQKFWKALHRIGWVENAINSDAGDVAQLAYLLPGGKYLLVPPRGDVSGYLRREFLPAFKGAPQGGAVMYFYVRDAQR